MKNRSKTTTVHSPWSISECLARMTADAEHIDNRLMAAPLNLTGANEPTLWDILQRIKKDLEEARKVWPRLPSAAAAQAPK